MANWNDVLNDVKARAGGTLAQDGGYLGFRNTPGYQQASDVITQGIAGAQGRQAPQVDQALQNQFRSQQLGQLNQLQGIANGTQVGAGQLAVQRQIANQLAAQQAQQRMARGPMAGMAALQGARQVGAVGLTGVGMGQQAQMQDAQQANALMAQIAQQGRGQDIGIAGQNAQLQQNQFNLNDQATLGYLSQLTGLSIAELQARAGLANAQAQRPSTLSTLLSAGGQIGAGAAMHSDERLKTDVTDGAKDIDAMLDRLVAKTYRYKDERHGKGARTGVMAQDLEKSKAGGRMVYDTADGKAVDVHKALSASLAAAARLNQRLRAVERRST